MLSWSAWLPSNRFRITWGDFQPDCSADRPVTGPRQVNNNDCLHGINYVSDEVTDQEWHFLVYQRILVTSWASLIIAGRSLKKQPEREILKATNPARELASGWCFVFCTDFENKKESFQWGIRWLGGRGLHTTWVIAQIFWKCLFSLDY